MKGQKEGETYNPLAGKYQIDVDNLWGKNWPESVKRWESLEEGAGGGQVSTCA